MRKLAFLLLLAGGVLGLGGCLATPAYTADENGARILRTWDYEIKQASEEFYYHMLFMPPSRTTKWSLY